MAQDRAIPVPRLTLAVVRTGTEPGPAAVPDTGTGPGTAPAPVPVATVPMTVPERGRLAVAHWTGTAASGARELWLRPDRLVHTVAHGKPETMKEHWTHVQSRSWVPEEMTGRPEKAVALAGILHHLIVAYPVKAMAKTGKFACEKADHAADRAITFYGLIAFIAVLVILVPHL